MKKKNLVYFILFLLQFAVIQKTMASAYWVDIKGSGKINQPVVIELCYGSMDDHGFRHRDTGKELQLAGDFIFKIINPDGSEQQLQLLMQKNCWQSTFIPVKSGHYRIIGFNDKHPVVDRSATKGENVLPVDYICAAYNIGNTYLDNDQPLQKLDLILTTDTSGKVTIKAFTDGKPSKKGTKLRVFNPENWEKELTLDQNGEAVFYPTIKGTYIIRQDIADPTGGTYLGIDYKSKRHRCNYFLVWD